MKRTVNELADGAKVAFMLFQQETTAPAKKSINSRLY